MGNRIVTKGTCKPYAGCRTIATHLCCALLTVILVGCEAPLDLSGVNAQLSRPTQRADQFQAIAQHQDIIVAVGGMGVIVKSADGGNSWRRTTLPDKPFLVDVTACPDGIFYAIDKNDGLWSGRLDGDWTRQSLPEMTEPQAMTCDTSNVIWVVGGFSAILHSADAGTRWETWSLDEDLYLTTIQFVDRQHGIATGEFGTVLMTADSGITWNRTSDLPDSFYPQSTYFTNPTEGWVVGLNGTIWKTDDGGQTWQNTPSGISKPLYGVTGSGNTLVAVGDNATILYHRTSETSWNQLNGVTNSRTWLRGIAGLGDGRFIAVGGDALVAITIPDNGAPSRAGATLRVNQ